MRPYGFTSSLRNLYVPLSVWCNSVFVSQRVLLHEPDKSHAGYKLQLYDFFIVPVSAGKGSSAKLTLLECNGAT